MQAYNSANGNFVNFQQRIKMIVDKLADGKHTVFAKKCGIPPSTMQTYITGTSIPKADHLEKIYSTFRINLNWLLTGEGQLFLGPEQGTGIGEDIGDFVLKDLVMIHQLEPRVSAGPNGEILYDKLGDFLPFKRWWIENLVGKSMDRQQDLKLVRVQGDSMTPTINAGEVALVDFGEQERINIKAGRIYLITQPDGATSVKRVVLTRIDNGYNLVCISDNPAYKPFEIKLELEQRLKRYILGRVRWVSKEFD